MRLFLTLNQNVRDLYLCDWIWDLLLLIEVHSVVTPCPFHNHYPQDIRGERDIPDFRNENLNGLYLHLQKYCYQSGLQWRKPEYNPFPVKPQVNNRLWERPDKILGYSLLSSVFVCTHSFFTLKADVSGKNIDILSYNSVCSRNKSKPFLSSCRTRSLVT